MTDCFPQFSSDATETLFNYVFYELEQVAQVRFAVLVTLWSHRIGQIMKVGCG